MALMRLHRWEDYDSGGGGGPERSAYRKATEYEAQDFMATLTFMKDSPNT